MWDNRNKSIREWRINMNKFEILSISAGWITGVIKDNNKEHLFDYSYIRNFLDNLMKALLYVNGAWPEDEKVFVFDNECEPVTEVWTLRKDNEKLNINITAFEDFTKQRFIEESVLVYDNYEFLTIFIFEIQSMLRKYGLLGYRDSWWHEFPISLFLKLIDIKEKKNLLSMSQIDIEENLGLEAQRSNLNNEIELIRNFSK